MLRALPHWRTFRGEKVKGSSTIKQSNGWVGGWQQALKSRTRTQPPDNLVGGVGEKVKGDSTTRQSIGWIGGKGISEYNFQCTSECSPDSMHL